MAEKKPRALPDAQQLPGLMQTEETAGRPPLEEAGDAQAASTAYSPARALQDQLEDTISAPKKRFGVLDTGRVLASASGITAILGVFFFTGIW